MTSIERVVLMKQCLILLLSFIVIIAFSGCYYLEPIDSGASDVHLSSDFSYSTAHIHTSSYQSITDDGLLAYEVSDGNVRIIAALTDDYCIQIPDEIDGYPVTVIGGGAFYQNSTCHSVILPETLRTIESGAFYRCSAIEDICIPNSVTYIASDAFYRVENLQFIYVAEGNGFYCDVDGILFSADMRELIAYPEGKASDEYKIPDSITTIKECSFGYCPQVKKIVIPTSVTLFPDGPLAAIYEAITIVSEEGSCAEDYALYWDIMFEILTFTPTITAPT